MGLLKASHGCFNNLKHTLSVQGKQGNGEEASNPNLNIAKPILPVAGIIKDYLFKVNGKVLAETSSQKTEKPTYLLYLPCIKRRKYYICHPSLL